MSRVEPALLNDGPASQVVARHLGGALSISLAAHAAALLLLAAMAHRFSTVRHAPADTRMPHVVRLSWPGELGGGGGSGDGHGSPPQRLERPGARAVAAIAAPPAPTIQPARPANVPDVPHPVVASIDPVESGLRITPGMSAAIAQPGDFMGPGSNDGAGNGKGPGNGDGDGAGLGDGFREGAGGGPPGPGGGEIAPVLIRQVRPNYTQAGILARAQGIIRMEATVLTDGSVGEVRIVHGFEPPFGLDLEAVSAVKQWRFRPGVRQGRVTPMRVSIELTFTLR